MAEHMKKRWCTHTVEWYSAVNRNESRRQRKWKGTRRPREQADGQQTGVLGAGRKGEVMKKLRPAVTEQGQGCAEEGM